MGKCLLCRSAKTNELLLGTLHIRGENVVHQNCLYLSSNLVQRGDETNDICFFTLRDIKIESKRTQNLICCYCRKTGANIGCCRNICRRTFHTYCGIQNGAQNQYMGTYKSFCNSHVQAYRERPSAHEKCSICMDQLIGDKESFSCTKYIHGKCCNNGWYHKECLQRYADSAGYFFKCPLCNDPDKFRLVALWGITVPDRDASWERTDAFADQLEVPLNCTADYCINSAGRESTKEGLFYCTLCGGNPMHPECTIYTGDDYCCKDCETIAKMSASYHYQEEQVDPLEIYIARQQEIRKQSASTKKPTPPDFSSDSEDDFAIITAAIEKKRKESARAMTALGNRASRIANMTPLSTIAPLRMRNHQTTPLNNADNRQSSLSNVNLRRRTSRSRLSTFGARLDEEMDTDEENNENEQLPQPVADGSRRTAGAPTLEEKQVDNAEAKKQKQNTPQTSAVVSRRTRSSCRLNPIKAVLDEMQVDNNEDKKENQQAPHPLTVESRRTRSSSRLNPIKAALNEMQVNRDVEKHQLPQTATALSSRSRSRSRRATISASVEEMQVDNDEDKLQPAAIVKRRQTCVSPSMLQKDTNPLISRGRPRARTMGPQTQNPAIDISCIAKRTRARSRK